MSYLDLALQYWNPSLGVTVPVPGASSQGRKRVRHLRFKKLDAFATSTSSGNPAAAVYLDSMEILTSGEKQQIARELKGFVSEVGFVSRVSRDAFRLQYFSSEREVAFGGHTTLAVVNDLARTDAGLKHVKEIHIHTPKGVIPAELPGDDRETVFVQAPDPVYAHCGIGLPEICRALRLPTRGIDTSQKISAVNAGVQTLCLPLKSLQDVAGCSPDFDVLNGLCRKHQLDAVVVYAPQALDPANHYHSRAFVPPYGYLEDPAGGSVTAALGYSLFRNGTWDGSPLRVEQNNDLDHPNIVRLSTRRPATGGIRVAFGGGAILRLEGEFSI